MKRLIFSSCTGFFLTLKTDSLPCIFLCARFRIIAVISWSSHSCLASKPKSFACIGVLWRRFQVSVFGVVAQAQSTETTYVAAKRKSVSIISATFFRVFPSSEYSLVMLRRCEAQSVLEWEHGAPVGRPGGGIVVAPNIGRPVVIYVPSMPWKELWRGSDGVTEA